MYFNTTNECGKTLEGYSRKADTQEDLILEFFRLHRGKAFAPHVVQAHVEGLHEAPLTSVRRAITSLTNKGELEKTDHKVAGPYGRESYTWRIPDGNS